MGVAGNFVVTGTAGTILDAWADLNGDDDFSDPGEQIAVNRVLTGGDDLISATFTVEGTTYARFRVSAADADVTSPTGRAANGEVEDYMVVVEGPIMLGDYGDALSIYGDTWHVAVANGPQLGLIGPDEELGTQSDDNLFGDPDEDGVTFLPFFTGVANTFIVTGTPGDILDAWAESQRRWRFQRLRRTDRSQQDAHRWRRHRLRHVYQRRHHLRPLPREYDGWTGSHRSGDRRRG